jgi:hypothetical protein
MYWFLVIGLGISFAKFITCFGTTPDAQSDTVTFVASAAMGRYFRASRTLAFRNKFAAARAGAAADALPAMRARAPAIIARLGVALRRVEALRRAEALLTLGDM